MVPEYPRCRDQGAATELGASPWWILAARCCLSAEPIGEPSLTESGCSEL
jgi:hypothetical protein